MPLGFKRAVCCAMVVICGLINGCSQHASTKNNRQMMHRLAPKIGQQMPSRILDKRGWAEDIASAITWQNIAPTEQNICATLAVIQQESGFQVDPPVANLEKIALKEMEKRAESRHISAFWVRAALQLNSSNGQTYAQRLAKAKTEQDLSRLYDDMLSHIPLGKQLFKNYNPVHTAGPMQVSIAFASQHADHYPWPLSSSLRDEVFTRRGGIYFGVLHLLTEPNEYADYVYLFADYNAGWYASRNAAFQVALHLISGKALDYDGDLLNFDQWGEGKTEQAAYSVAKQLKMAPKTIKNALERGQQADFSKTQLWQRVFALADKKKGSRLPRAVLPSIHLQSPKIHRQLTTAWYAQQVNRRFTRCLKNWK